MKLPLYQIDAFTDRPFRGNPAAVVPLEKWLPDETLQRIAAENNLPETAFVLPGADAMPLRWFTPTIEVDLCGHATLATAHVLFRYYLPQAQELVFDTRSGHLRVRREGELISLDFPARPGQRIDIDEALVSALGARPSAVFRARDVMAVFEAEAQVRDLQPNVERVAALDTFAVIVTAPGAAVDYVYRFFAPRHGIAEDPVTGSANCTLVPYWSGRLGRTDLTAKQLSARGGDLNLTMAGDRVLIAGRAVEYLRGEITLA